MEVSSRPMAGFSLSSDGGLVFIDIQENWFLEDCMLNNLIEKPARSSEVIRSTNDGDNLFRCLLQEKLCLWKVGNRNFTRILGAQDSHAVILEEGSPDTVDRWIRNLGSWFFLALNGLARDTVIIPNSSVVYSRWIYWKIQRRGTGGEGQRILQFDTMNYGHRIFRKSHGKGG